MTGPRAGGARPVHLLGDRAVLVMCTDLAEVLALDAALRAEPVRGQRDLQPAERSLLVVLDGPRAAAAAAAVLARLDVPPVSGKSAHVVEVDVRYDGEDLDDVAALTGLSPSGVVAAHTAARWTAAFAGFAPGFVYLVGDFPAVPRRDTPRTAVPAGSVAVGGAYSAVYPRRSPGGWRLLGRTGVALWDAAADPPALVRPGDVVRFRAVREVVHARPVRRSSRPTPGDVTALDAGPTLTVLDPGPLTLVEDLGRPGLGDLGVAPGGAADRAAARLANRLVGNARTAAVLETVLGGLRLRAERRAVVAIAGAAAHLDVEHADGGSSSVPAGTPVALAPGDVLRVPLPVTGLRSYLAVRGGVDVPPELGSRSTDLLSGLGPPALAAGGPLLVGAAVAGAVGDPVPAEAPAAGRVGVRAVAGPDAGLPGSEALWDAVWTVSPSSNRVGVRLTGPALPAVTSDARPSAGVVQGAVQLPPSGGPVVFGPDHPVTGGYPVVAVVVDADLDRLAQLRPGQELRFVRVPDAASSCVDSGGGVTDAGSVRSRPRPARPGGAP